MFSILIGMKRCSRCKTLLGDGEFYGDCYYCKPCHREYGRKYRRAYDRRPKTIARKEAKRKIADYYHRPSVLVREQAKQAVRKAVRNGTLKKRPCIVCRERKSQGHHPDYTKPLQVIWLCSKHHNEIHGRRK